ncbi:MAG: serine hydrolase [Gemmatimonadetes bacterium]|nr:serine hydrolase [Gemmatimonadota bacterium]
MITLLPLLASAALAAGGRSTLALGARAVADGHLSRAVASAPAGGLPERAPKAVGMSASRLAAIDRVIKKGMKAGGFPGAAVVIGRRGAAVLRRGYGKLGWNTTDDDVDADRTIYDLASLTKVVGTTTALMILFDEGKLGLDDPVSKYIPAFTGGDKNLVTVRMLLEHRSGLPAGRDLWRIANTPGDAKFAVITTDLVCKPGDCYIYSDLGADLMGWVAEAAAGEPIDQFLRARVFEPLGMTSTMYRPDASYTKRVAPTEVTPPRGYPLRGEVHDENAFALGGIAGHAGLFATASDVSVFAQMMLNNGVYEGTRIIADSTVRLFTRRAAGTRALGWDTCATEHGGCGQFFSERSYGHTGYTGTSLWIDPDRELFVVLLTNRVHAARARRPALVIADVRADLADAASVSVVDDPLNFVTRPVSYRADTEYRKWNRPMPKPRRGRGARKGKGAKAGASAHASKGGPKSKGKPAAKPKPGPKKKHK